MTHPGGRPRKYKTKEELQEKIDAFFAECEENNEPLTVTGLAIACDMDRQRLLNYSKDEEFYDTIKKAKEKIQAWVEKQLYNGKATAGVIFSLKNNYGWKDKVETEISGGNVSININRQAK